MAYQITIPVMQDDIERPLHNDGLRVMVYGTLRCGERNHCYLKNQTYLGAFQTPAIYTLYDTGPYPAAVANGGTALTGEVYAVDTSCFAQLDVLEDFPHSYTRELIATPFGRAWIYLWIAPLAPHWGRIGGDWCAHLADKQLPPRPLT